MRIHSTIIQASSSPSFRSFGWLVGGFISLSAAASTLEAAIVTNAPLALSSTGAAVPDVGASIVRMVGALAIVITLFLGGAWLVKNRHRFGAARARAMRLSVLEVKALGHRQALMVVGYEQQRMLLATSPTGVSLVTHLPEASSEEGSAQVPAAAMNFADVLQHLVHRKA